MSWALQEGLRNILKSESGAEVFPVGQRNGFALVYPNSYHVGMSNLGIHILYQQINRRGDTACERFFLPDKAQVTQYKKSNTPLMSIENQQALYEFPLIGFAISFEMDYFNLLEILSLGKVELLAADRGEEDPIVIAGGPCATFNPEPLSEVMDAFVIGEGEETIHALLDVYYEAKYSHCTREEILRRLAKLPGMYVPKFYCPRYGENSEIVGIEVLADAPPAVERQWIADLDQFEAQTVIFTKNTEFSGLYLLEIARGCGRHCRFCMAGYCFRKPRNRSLIKLQKSLEAAQECNRKVGLMGAAISDYPEIDALCDRILMMSLQMTVASFRADSVTEKFVRALAKSGARSLTLAPEAGSARLRAIINKGISEADIFNAVDLGVKIGISNFRLYIMVGLPFEEDDDIQAIILMAETVKAHMERLDSKGKLTLSINPFIPKPMTPFQWLPMEQMKTVEQRLKRIKNALKAQKGIEVLIESPKESYVQGILARGDRRVGKALCDAHRMGGAKAFRRAMRDNQLDEDFYLYRRRGKDEIFPWDMLHMGFDRIYLYQELQKAMEEKATPPCFDKCRRCGICK